MEIRFHPERAVCPPLNLTGTVVGKGISLTDLDIHRPSYTYSDELELREDLDLPT